MSEVRIKGIDPQVISASFEMSDLQKKNPEWLWCGDTNIPTYGRWSASSETAPYIRGDLVVSQLAAQGAEIEQLRKMAEENKVLFLHAVKLCWNAHENVKRLTRERDEARSNVELIKLRDAWPTPI